MERTVFTSFLNSMLSLSALGVLGFFWSSPDSPPTPPKSEGDWRLLDAVTYENITIFPVVSSNSYDTSSFLTLEEGLSSGEVIVREQGSEGMSRGRGTLTPADDRRSSSAAVNQLVLINRSKRPLILLAGELVSGGKQDRVIAKDRIIAPGSNPLPLDVFCVEHGRWSSGLEFSAAKTMVHPSVREQAAVKQSQNEVWDAVRAGSTAKAAAAAPPPRLSSREISGTIASAAPTQSYDKIYNGSGVGVSVDGFVSEVQKRFARATSGLKNERVVGVIVAYGGEVAWSDIFASNELFDNYWNKLLRSYAVEALARPALREKATAEDASEFLRRLNGREIQESEPNVYRRREITEGQFSQIELDALQPKTMTLHRLLLHRTS